MNRNFTFPILLALFTALVPLGLQGQCTYALDLFDSFGDGWNGGTLTVVNGNDTFDVTLPNGDYDRITFDVVEGDSLKFFWQAGSFAFEPSFTLLQAPCDIIFEQPQGIPSGFVYATEVFCVDCPRLCANQVRIVNVRDTFTDVAWQLLPEAEFFVLEVGPLGFTQGMGTVYNPTDNDFRIGGLEEMTEYEFYLSAVCPSGDTSATVGPYPFKTLFTNDVGIVDVTMPGSDCNLDPSTQLEIGIKNFGGIPQTFLDIFFSVNGVQQPINMPIDGVYTGVVGTDSTEYFTFDAQVPVSGPGAYEIAVWTALEGDSVINNDTFYYVFNHIRSVDADQIPYFEDFESGDGTLAASSESVNSTWEYGEPASGPGVASSGQFVWATNLSGNHNNDERSYLLLPCFDFSGLDKDPMIAFDMYLQSAFSGDSVFVEMSVDGGTTWTRVGENGTGLNWYNGNFNDDADIWTSNGGVSGWRTVSNIMEGASGENDVKVRIALDAPGFAFSPGIFVDDIRVFEQLENNLAATEAQVQPAFDCGDPMTPVQVSITNFGSATQTGFDVSYQINDGPVVTENVGTLSLAPYEQGFYAFNQTFDSETPGTYEIKVWTDLVSDLDLANDTALVTYSNTFDLPLNEDFESGSLADGWSNSGGFVGNSSAGTLAFRANLWQFTTSYEMITANYGPVMTGDTMTFDYRMVDFGSNAPTTLSIFDSLLVDITTDCGNTYTRVYSVGAENHTTSANFATVGISLANFVGESIRVRFSGVLLSGGTNDYYQEIDNINLARCTGGFNTLVNVTDASGSGAMDGSASVSPQSGFPSFTYAWSTGDNTATVTGLDPGDYQVTITDAFGCTETVNVTVGVAVGVTELEDKIHSVVLAPNPTTGQAVLRVQFTEQVDAQLQILNMMGQSVTQIDLGRVNRIDRPIALNGVPNGIYLVRLMADGKVKTLKLVKSE